jgi:hypothetical protein
MAKAVLAGVAALSLLAAAGTAHATALPDAFVGEWCRVTSEDTVPQFYDNVKAEQMEECEEGTIEIRKDSYSQVWDKCTFEKIEQTEPGVYLIRARCQAQSEGGSGGIGVFWTVNSE